MGFTFVCITLVYSEESKYEVNATWASDTLVYFLPNKTTKIGLALIVANMDQFSTVCVTHLE